MAPVANCYIESWIGSLKRECLNHLWCFSLGELDYISAVFVAYHNELRPHQSKNNEPLRFAYQPPPAKPAATGPIQCREILGGLVKYYYRKAA